MNTIRAFTLTLFCAFTTLYCSDPQENKVKQQEDETRELIQILIERQVDNYLKLSPSSVESIEQYHDQVHDFLTKHLLPFCDSYKNMVLDTSSAIAHIKLRCYAGEGVMPCEQEHKHVLKKVPWRTYRTLFSQQYPGKTYNQELIETNNQCATMALALLKAQKETHEP